MITLTHIMEVIDASAPDPPRDPDGDLAELGIVPADLYVAARYMATLCAMSTADATLAASAAFTMGVGVGFRLHREHGDAA